MSRKDEINKNQEADKVFTCNCCGRKFIKHFICACCGAKFTWNELLNHRGKNDTD